MSPSIRTMGFFMSEINFCNTKEQLNHFGEVVTGKTNGSPSGSDISVSTLPYTGQVRKTLPELEAEYFSAIQSAGGEALNNGVWAAGQTFTAYNQYMVYNGVPYKPKTTTTLPYGPVGSTPDLNFVQPYAEVTQATLESLEVQITGLNTYPSDQRKTASTVSPYNDCPVNTDSLRDASGGFVYLTSQKVSGIITALDFASRTATVGGVSVNLVPRKQELNFKSLSDMLNGSASLVVGDICSTPYNKWEVTSLSVPMTIANFTRVNLEFPSMSDLLATTTYSDEETFRVTSFYGGYATDSLANFLPSGGGQFVFDSTRNKSEHNGITVISPTVPFGTTLGQRDSWLAGTGETDPSGQGCLVRVFGGELNMLWSGATRSNVDDNKTPINSVIALSLSKELPVYVPKGDYRSSDRVLFDLSATPNRRMPEWRGDGPYTSSIRSSSVVSPSIAVFGSNAGPDHFQGKLTRLGFSADTPNVAFAFGLNDLSDNLGNFTTDQCFFGNPNTTSSMTAVSLQCNWMFDCEFRNIVVVGKPNAGTALDARKLHFCHFLNGSYSNAYFGVNFQDGGDAFCHGVTFTVPDIENVTVGAFCNQSSVRAITFDNPFIDVRDPIANNEPAGGFMFDWRNSDVSGLTVNNVDPARVYSFVYGGNAFSTQTNFSKINLNGRYPNQVDPALPAPDIAYFNNTGQTQRVEVFDGDVTNIFINGESRGNPNGPYSLTLNSGEFIALRYSSAPNWRWKALA